MSVDAACATCERAQIPFSPVAKPGDLFADPQLNAGGGMMKTRLPDGRYAKLPRLPLQIGAHEFALRRQPPGLGEHNDELIAELESRRATAKPG